MPRYAVTEKFVVDAEGLLQAFRVIARSEHDAAIHYLNRTDADKKLNAARLKAGDEIKVSVWDTSKQWPNGNPLHFTVLNVTKAG